MAYVLAAADLGGFPPEARALGVQHLALLRRLPPAFAALLLREIQGYDWRFPAERSDINRQLEILAKLDAAALTAMMSGFGALSISEAMKDERWGAAPGEFVEKLTAYLWDCA